MSYLTQTLRSTPQGDEWYNILKCNYPQCIEGLDKVSYKLERLILSRQKGFTPEPNFIMNPFHKIRFCDVRIVMICKEPYGNYIATGIPVQTRNGAVTATSKIFKSFIETIFHDVDDNNYMDIYYGAGILVINAAFTKINTKDKRYALNESHLSLWANFMYPFLKFMKSQKIPILMLGKEAKELSHAVEPYSLIYKSEFPKDWKSESNFTQVTSELIYKYILSGE